MYWRYKKELTPEEVKKLPSYVEVHLEGKDRFGEISWLEGHVVQSGRKKVFSYDTPIGRETKDIKVYRNKVWVVNGGKQ